MQPTENRADSFASTVAWVTRIATIATIIGGLAGVALSIGYLLTSDKPHMRGVIGAPLGCAVVFGGMTAGLALLFAPGAFFTSEKGQQYLQVSAHEAQPARALSSRSFCCSDVDSSPCW